MLRDLNEYRYYGHERLKKCEKPDCLRLTTAIYCCGACNYADDMKFELEDNKPPPLGHSEFCNTRYIERTEKGIKYKL